ncbi:MAG: hypothetical protein HY062_02620 [Bacteroidetes bacterium]|nr:hypothetical protein [Bacteroidota bacterium]
MFRSIFLFLFLSNALLASDSLVVKLHFVYGSRPKHAYKNTEPKFFGGIHGGHVFLEVDHKIISFGTNNGKWHVFAHKSKSAGIYREDKSLAWRGDSAKKKITTIIIPMTEEQLLKFKATEKLYFEKTPYDYAFIGMRCAAGAYDMLSKSEICRPLSRSRTITKYFYPKKLRKRLLKRAEKEHWQVIKQEGRTTRIWERD